MSVDPPRHTVECSRSTPPLPPLSPSPSPHPLLSSLTVSPQGQIQVFARELLKSRKMWECDKRSAKSISPEAFSIGKFDLIWYKKSQVANAPPKKPQEGSDFAQFAKFCKVWRHWSLSAGQNPLKQGGVKERGEAEKNKQWLLHQWLKLGGRAKKIFFFHHPVVKKHHSTTWMLERCRRRRPRRRERSKGVLQVVLPGGAKVRKAKLSGKKNVRIKVSLSPQTIN